MTLELFLILVGLWVCLGLIDAWVLHELGRSDWRLVALCALSGPLSLSIVYDEVRPADTDGTSTASGEQPVATVATPAPDESAPLVVDEPAGGRDKPLDWPADDPETPLILLGYRSLSDH